MGHQITAIVTPDPCDQETAQRFDLVVVPLPGLTMLPIDHYYTAYWQATMGCTGMLDSPPGAPCIFPCEAVIARIVSELTGNTEPRFGIIFTDYFGGAGDQCAGLYAGVRRVALADVSIDAVLRALGVVRAPGRDELDTVELGTHRHNPDVLDRYRELCDELGV